MTHSRSVVKSIGIMGVGLFISKALAFANAFFLRMFLGPYQVGVWTLLQVILDWSKYSSLGISSSVMQEIPRKLSRGEKAGAKKVQDIAFSCTLYGAGFFSLCTLIYALVCRDSLNRLLFWSLILLSGIVVVQRIYQLLFFVLRGRKDFRTHVLIGILGNLTYVVLVLFLASRWKLIGWGVALLVSGCVAVGFGLKKISFFRLLPINRDVWPLVVSGMAILGLEMIVSAFRSVDRIIVANLIGFREMGFYSIALSASNGIYTIPYVVGIVTFPHFQQKYAKRWRVEDVAQLVIHSSLGLVYIMPFLISLAWIIGSFLVAKVLPSFSPGLEALKILALGTYFLSLAQPFTAFLVTIQKRLLLLIVTLLVLGLLVVSELFLAKAHFGINAIALASSIAFFIYFCFSFFTSLFFLESAKQQAIVFLKAIVVFGYCGGLLWFCDRAWEGHSLYEVFLKSLVALIGLLPLLPMLHRETKVISSLKDLLFSKNNEPREKLPEIDSGEV